MARAKKSKEATMTNQTAEVVHSLKGFNLDWTCRGFQFEPGKTYEHDGDVEACEGGFHAIEGHPLEVFGYYPPGTSRYAEVVQSGKLSRHGIDSKIASAKITIGVELHLHEIIQRAVKWVFDRAKPEEGASATGDQGAASATGDRGAASATGYWGAASATGDRGAASATGYQGAASATGDQGAASATGYQGAASATGNRGAASATGDRGAASATGYQGAASATGYQGVAMACGHEGRVMGRDGCALFLVYRDPDNGEIRHTWSGIAGRAGIKADVWYTLNDRGEPVEVTP